MTDVRLTATNPEDSTVVPVACNTKGELLLEPPQVVEGPPGEKGDKGDKGDPGDPGDPFTGNFVGDVSFTGDTLFNGKVAIGATNDAFDFAVQGDICLGDNTGYGLLQFGNDANEPDNFHFASTGDGKFLAFNGVAGKGVELFGVTNNGYIGLGRSDPWGRVHVTSGNVFLEFNNTVYSNCRWTNKWEYLNPDAFNAYINPSLQNNRLALGTSSPGVAPEERIAVLGTGEVGVGTPAPRALFEVAGEVIIRSRGSSWVLAESNGLCHLVPVEASRQASPEYDPEGEPVTPQALGPLPELRDIPSELTMVEQQLQKVMERLKMAPEAGWEVWDGSD